MIRKFLIVCIIALNIQSILQAHGVQIQLTIDGNKIVTREALDDFYGPGITTPKSLYIVPLAQTPTVTPPGMPNGQFQWTTYPTDTQPIYNSGPGYAYGWSTFTTSTTLSLNIKDALKVWNGSSFVDPGMEQVEVFRGNAGLASPTSAITHDVSLASLPIPITNVSGDGGHSSIRYRLLGTRSADLNTFNDRTIEGDDGMYLLKFSLSTTQFGIGESDPFYFLLNKNASPADYAGAINALGFAPEAIQAIPEPSTMVLGSLGLLGFMLFRRKRMAG